MKSLLLFPFLLACGSSAIVYTADGDSYEGRIKGHGNGHVYIQGQSIDSSEIEDIDHPGNVAGIIGTIVASIGVLSAQENCKEEVKAQDPSLCGGSGVWILTGLPIAIYGFITHSNSVDRAGQ